MRGHKSGKIREKFIAQGTGFELTGIGLNPN